MGRELVRQLASQGCHVATCDVSEESLDETRTLAEEGAPAGTLVTTFVADVSDEAQWLAFREHVTGAHRTDHVNLLFNNAGIGGGGSFLADERGQWDATFAVKGFTEALITDLRLNAPHVTASVVMPGHIGTGIVLNSFRYFGLDPKHLDEGQLAQVRARLGSQGIDASGASDEDLQNGMQLQAEMFRDLAPTSAAQAATIILDGVRAGRWRILVGADAEHLDQMVREAPEDAYEPSFMERLRAEGVFGAMSL